MGGQGFGTLCVGASLVRGPRGSPSSQGPLCTLCQGLLSWLSTSAASLDPLKPISRANWEHWHREWCPSPGPLGEGLSPEGGGEIEVQEDQATHPKTPGS